MGPGAAGGCLDLPPPPRPAELPLTLVAAVALIDADGRVLVNQRPAGKPLAGWWEFPGGKLRPGETPEAAVVRELKEELAIDLSESCLAPLTFASYSYPDFHLLMPLFVARVWRGQPTPREGQALKWLFPRELARLETLLPADKPLIPILRDLL
jgi:8-oxo-dGTP diphosphatase